MDLTEFDSLGNEIKYIRRSLGLTQRQAGKIFGGGTNAFCRYETGKAAPLRSTVHLLRLLFKYPDELNNLRKS